MGRTGGGGSGGWGLVQPGKGVERAEDRRRAYVRRSEEWGVIVVSGWFR